MDGKKNFESPVIPAKFRSGARAGIHKKSIGFVYSLKKPHKKLKVWQLSMEAAKDAYEITKQFPSDERYGLVSQIRRSSVSIASNIAEGAARNTEKEFSSFLYIARGSLSELDTQMELAVKLGIVDEATWKRFDYKLEAVDKMLSGLINSQKQKK